MSVNIVIRPASFGRATLVGWTGGWAHLGQIARAIVFRLLLASALVLPFPAARLFDQVAAADSLTPALSQREGADGGGPPASDAGSTAASVVPFCLLTSDACLLEDDQPATLERLLATPRPGRDPVAITSRLAGATIPWVATQPFTGPLEVGRHDTFYDLDQGDNTYKPHDAELRLVTEHAYWYVQVGQRVDDGDLAKAAEFFDQQTVPIVHRVFGEEWSPGIDGDPRITIFLGTAPGVSAYFSSADELPRSVFPYSNEREMIHVNLPALSPNSVTFNSTLAHEFQHMVHWHQNPLTETWLDEGLAELSSSLVVTQRTPSIGGFERQPDIPLTTWSQTSQASLHYQASYLFAHYLNQRFGGSDGMRQLLAEHGRPPETITAFLSDAGFGVTFDDVFEDWLVANLLDDATVGDGRYVHNGIDHHASTTRTLQLNDAPADEVVHQYGGEYIELQGDGTDATLEFDGAPTVRLAPADPTSGRSAWWSNRADSMDSTLTRHFDLSGVSSATLQFNLWYETERDFDFAYVLASADGGTTWRVLPGAHAEGQSRSGYAIGPGYTGRSGVAGDAAGSPTWIGETVDLTPFAGQNDVLIRFEYITDQGFNLSGAMIDDIAIPEIGFNDDAETDNGWAAEGFFRSDNTIPQTWSLQLVTHRRDGATSVRALRADTAGHLAEPIPSLGGDIDSAILVVSGLAPRTLETAPFRVSLHPSA
jgi:hypothetical protein